MGHLHSHGLSMLTFSIVLELIESLTSHFLFLTRVVILTGAGSIVVSERSAVIALATIAKSLRSCIDAR